MFYTTLTRKFKEQRSVIGVKSNFDLGQFMEAMNECTAELFGLAGHTHGHIKPFDFPRG